jgi:hypothetical protein
MKQGRSLRMIRHRYYKRNLIPRVQFSAIHSHNLRLQCAHVWMLNITSDKKLLYKTELWSWSSLSSVSVTEHREVRFTNQLHIKVCSHQTYIFFSRKAWPCIWFARHRTLCPNEFEGLISNNPLTSYHSIVFNLITVDFPILKMADVFVAIGYKERQPTL